MVSHRSFSTETIPIEQIVLHAPQPAALSECAAYVAECSHQWCKSEQMCHSSCDHSLSIQPNAEGNIVGQLVSQRPSTRAMVCEAFWQTGCAPEKLRRAVACTHIALGAEPRHACDARVQANLT